MKRYIVVFMLSLGSFLSSQLKADSDATNAYTQFEKGQVYHLLADKVHVRSAPDKGSELVATLPVGSAVTVGEYDGELTIKGHTAPWYEVSFVEDGKNMKGYIWAGFIAAQSVESGAEPGLFYHYGVEEVIEHEYYNEVRVQVRLEKGNKELSKTVFEAIGGLNTWNSGSISDARGVPGIAEIFNIEFSDGHCAGAFGDAVVFRKGHELIHVMNLQDGADAPVFSDESFIYPSDSGGIKGKIIWTMVSGEYGDDGEEYIDQQQKKIFYWTGTALKEEK